MDFIYQTLSDIKSLKIQGATSILKASLQSIKKIYRENPNLSFSKLKKIVSLLQNARPTEPLTQNCLNLFLIKILDQKNPIQAIAEIEGLLEKIEGKILKNSLDALKNYDLILTHCHSSTVENMLVAISKFNPNLKIFATETRPKMQGKITARNLAAKGIKITLIVDSEAAFLISKEDHQGIEAVLFGADAITKEGEAINKVGSYGIALSAWKENIPLYIAATLLKLSLKDVKIEERNPDEVWPNPPYGVKILNPAFDKVPAKFITGFITEAGILKPDEITAKTLDIYPWIEKKG